MHHDYQQLELQMLVDLLAEETKEYTKAFVSGSLKDGIQHRAIIDALVEEIQIRKRAVMLPGADESNFRNNFPCC
jgi:hypothetical protein